MEKEREGYYKYLVNEVEDYYLSVEHMILKDFFESLLHINWKTSDDMTVEHLDKKIWKTFILLDYFNNMRTDK
jgi:hypothetical protein